MMLQCIYMLLSVEDYVGDYVGDDVGDDVGGPVGGLTGGYECGGGYISVGDGHGGRTGG